jgi:hypothetical protein
MASLRRMLEAKYGGLLVTTPTKAAKNISSQPAKLLCTVVPSGLEMMFKEVSKASGPDEIKAIVAKYR